MTPSELIKQCNEQINIMESINSPKEKADISLLLPGKWGKTNKRRLCKIKGAPIGEIVQDDFGKGLVVMFNAIEVKRFITDQMYKCVRKKERNETKIW